MILVTTATFYLTCAAIAVSGGEHDPFSGADYFLRYNFENEADLDFDGQPDDWSKRRGPKFPSYATAGIDDTQGESESHRSLRFKANGGSAIMYSPPEPIDPLHSYVIQGYIRTEKLQHNAALISVSFLNHKRQRVQRFLGRPVSGTHRGWIAVKLGPFAPTQDVRFVVIGCHLVRGKKMDIEGSAWFDNLSVGRLPQLWLDSNFHTPFVKRDATVIITSSVSGLDAGRNYRLHVQLMNSAGQLKQENYFPIQTTTQKQDESIPTTARRLLKDWKLESQDYGYYRVRSTLERDSEVVLHKESSFAVMDIVGQEKFSGEFGWSVSNTAHTMPAEKLADIAVEAGISWLKYPLWQSVLAKNEDQPARIVQMFNLLSQRGITPVGLLNDPPPVLRRQFARSWSGISEIFTMPSSFWSPSLEPVIARYSSTVRYWQIGGDSDASFVGMSRLPATVANVKREFDRIGRDTRIGLHWEWDVPLPSRTEMPHTFLSLGSRQPLTGPELTEKLASSRRSDLPRWVLLKPLAKSKHEPEERSADLVKRMVAAKIGGADAIFAYDVFDAEYGLMHRNGSPTLLFLPWRTTALALQGAEYLGSFNLTGNSENFAFSRGDEVVLVVWNDKPTIEKVYLGEKVTATDVWGGQQRIPVDRKTKQQVINVGPTPLVIRGCSKAVARWRMAVQFEKGRLASRTGGQNEAILGENTFPQGISGEAVLNVHRRAREWEVDPSRWALHMGAQEQFRLPLLLTLPHDASQGDERLSIDFSITADRPYHFRVYRPLHVGLGDVQLQVFEKKLEDGRLEIEQIMVNNTSDVLNFRCSLFVPGHRRQKQVVTKLGNGQDRKFYYVANYKALGTETLRIRAEEVGGRRVLNNHWIIGQNVREN
jgi:hypothetical protein